MVADAAVLLEGGAVTRATMAVAGVVVVVGPRRTATEEGVGLADTVAAGGPRSLEVTALTKPAGATGATSEEATGGACSRLGGMEAVEEAGEWPHPWYCKGEGDSSSHATMTSVKVF